jgi:hypothetical protein
LTKREGLPVEERLVLLEIMQDSLIQMTDRTSRALEGLGKALEKIAFNDLSHINDTLITIQEQANRHDQKLEVIGNKLKNHLKECQEANKKPMMMQNWLMVGGFSFIALLIALLAAMIAFHVWTP